LSDFRFTPALSWHGEERTCVKEMCTLPSRGKRRGASQESERITTKADCYGFAVLMWELATRLYPWLGLGLLNVRLALCVASTGPCFVQ
jgi:hypothetical protein